MKLAFNRRQESILQKFVSADFEQIASSVDLSVTTKRLRYLCVNNWMQKIYLNMWDRFRMEPDKQSKTQPSLNHSTRPSDETTPSTTSQTNTQVMNQPSRASYHENIGPQMPYYYYYPMDRSQAPRFGLIRGYHRQMYEPVSQKRTCCECTTGDGVAVPSESKCNWGVACGCVLLIIGIIAILMGFLIPPKFYKRNAHAHLTPEQRHELNQIDLFIDMFVISGLSVLSIGGLLISGALLLPLLRRRTEHSYDEPIRYFGNEVYVKTEDLPMNKSGKPSIDLGFHKDVVPADITLRKIQPEREKSEPVDLTTWKWSCNDAYKKIT